MNTKDAIVTIATSAAIVGPIIETAMEHNSVILTTESFTAYHHPKKHHGHPLDEQPGPLPRQSLSIYGAVMSGRWEPFPGTTVSFPSMGT